MVTTRDRHDLLPLAVRSALDQTLDDLEVVVVDDGSTRPVSLPAHPRLSIVRVPASRGVSAARNAGTRVARGALVSYLDDDDRLLPQFAEVSIAALDRTELPPPVAVLSGLEVVRPDGGIGARHLPPTLARGNHFALEEVPPDRSFQTKQTLVAPRSVLEAIGGWDERFRSRVTTELFLRLNPACSLLGLDQVTYQLIAHHGPRLSRTAVLRRESWNHLLEVHGELFRAHPRRYTAMLLDEATATLRAGAHHEGLRLLTAAFRRAPWTALRRLASVARRRFVDVRP